MPKPDLKDLSTANEIDLSVRGRKIRSRYI